MAGASGCVPGQSAMLSSGCQRLCFGLPLMDTLRNNISPNKLPFVEDVGQFILQK